MERGVSGSALLVDDQEARFERRRGRDMETFFEGLLVIEFIGIA